MSEDTGMRNFLIAVICGMVGLTFVVLCSFPSNIDEVVVSGHITKITLFKEYYLLYVEKDTKKIMKELRDMISVEFEAFLNILGEPGKKNISPHHPEDTTAVSSVSSSPGSPPPPRQGCFYCTDCNLEITVAEKDFSERRYFKPLCRECQKHYKV